MSFVPSEYSDIAEDAQSAAGIAFNTAVAKAAQVRYEVLKPVIAAENAIDDAKTAISWAPWILGGVLLLGVWAYSGGKRRNPRAAPAKGDWNYIPSTDNFRDIARDSITGNVEGSIRSFSELEADPTLRTAGRLGGRSVKHAAVGQIAFAPRVLHLIGLWPT